MLNLMHIYVIENDVTKLVQNIDPKLSDPGRAVYQSFD